MKQRLLFCLVIWALLHPVVAQITISNTIFPVVGDTLHYVFGNQPGAINQVYTPPGGGEQWDLSNLQPTQFWNQIMEFPQEGTAFDAFLAASVLYNPANSNSEVYLQVTGTQVNDLGYFGQDPLGLGLNLLFVRAPGLEESWAPTSFFDIRQSASNVLTAFDAPIAPPLLLNLVPTADSFRIRITNQRIGVIDAWGVLSIPGGSFDVLRKKQTEYKSTALDVKVAPLGWIDISTIGGQQILPLGTDTITTFHFLNDMSKETIAICTLNTAQNLVTGVQYKAVNTSSASFTPSFNEEIFAYPNPVRNTLNVDYAIDAGATFQINLINTQGRPVFEQTMKASATESTFSIPVAHLAPGVYTLILMRNGALVGRVIVSKI